VRFEADLTNDQGDSQVVLTGDDGVLVITGERLPGTARAMRSGAGLPNIGVRRLSDLLAENGATVRLESPSAPIVTLGEGARPQLLTRMFGMRHVRIESARGIVNALRPGTGKTSLVIMSSAVVALVWGLRAKRG